MDSDLDQILVTIVGFFGLLTLLLVVLDRLESTLNAPTKPLRHRIQQFWQLVIRAKR